MLPPAAQQQYTSGATHVCWCVDQHSSTAAQQHSPPPPPPHLLSVNVVHGDALVGVGTALLAVGFAARERWHRQQDIGVLRRRAEELADLHEEVRLTHLDLEQQNHEVRLSHVEVQMHNSQLQAISEDRLMLLGILSHDLKNPLTAIQGLAEAMTSTELSAEEYQEYAAVILDSSYRMNNLVRGFLDLSRIESGSIRLESIRFDIADTVLALVEQYQHIAAQKRIGICIERAEETDYSVIADESSSQQVIENILSNAIKYSPLGKNIFVRIALRDTVVRVEVQDEGPGISSEDMQKLFGKFARLSARPTGGEHSTGLGLSIVKRMVEAMNGRVWCESELGKGATFIVELPVATTE
jgi:signal transduction histidine kinase